MLKTEVICNSCEKHFIVVDVEDSQPVFCPFCADPINSDVGSEEEE